MPAGVNLLLYSLFAVSLFLIKDLKVHLVLSAVVVCLLFLVPFRKIKGGLVPIMLFMVITFTSNTLYGSGKVVYTLSSLIITDEGLRLASVRTLRLFDMIFGAKVLTAVTPLEAMLDALKRAARPLERIGVPVHEFFTTMVLTLRCFPVLKQRLNDTYKENVEGKTAVTFMEKTKLVASFLVPLFVESMRNPERFFGDESKTV
ncbi:MAG: energy-coupling factor transporter transmembrane component T family protein [Nitrospirota bacterium]